MASIPFTCMFPFAILDYTFYNPLCFQYVAAANTAEDFQRGYVYHAVESDEACRQVLMSLDEGPGHIFKDMLQLLQPEAAVSVLRVMEQYDVILSHKIRCYKGKAEESAEAVKKHELKANIKEDGESLLRNLMVTLESYRPLFRKDVVCAVHANQRCQMMPDADSVLGQSGGGLRIFMAGTSCQDWSSMGCMLSLAGKSVLPFAIELQLVKHELPHVFFHECTRNFNVSILQENLPEYDIHSCVLRPGDHGFPIHRPRRYTVCVRKDWQLTADLKQMACLRRAPAFDGGKLFCAPEPLVQYSDQQIAG